MVQLGRLEDHVIMMRTVAIVTGSTGRPLDRETEHHDVPWTPRIS